MTKQERVDATWTAMNAAPREDRDAFRDAYVAALQAMDATDDTPEIKAEQARRDEANYQARQADKAERDEESHRRTMDGSARRESLAYDADRRALDEAMNTEPSDL